LLARPELTSFLHNNEGGVRSVAFSSNGKTLAAGYDSGYRPASGVSVSGVLLFDVARRRRLGVPLTGPEGVINSVAFSPDGRTLAAGYEEYDSGDGRGGVVLWDVARRERLVDQWLAVAEGDVVSVAFSPDGKTLAAGCRRTIRVGGGVVLWDVVRRERLVDQPLAVAEGGVESIAFSPDGKTLAAGYDGGVVLWDVARRERLVDQPLAVAEGGVESIAFSPDGKTLAAGGNGGVVLWDVVRRERLVDQPLAVAGRRVVSVAFSPNGKTLAAGCRRTIRDGGNLEVRRDGGVVLWDVVRRERLVDQPLAVAEGEVESIAFSPDGKTLAAAYDGGVFSGVHVSGVLLFDVARRRRLGVPLAGPEGVVDSVAFSPDGRTLAAGGDGGVVLWDVARRERLVDQPLAVAEGGVESIAFSPDGKTLAAGGNGGVVLWDVVRRERLVDQPLAVAGRRVVSVAFSPDGKTLAAGCRRTIRDGGNLEVRRDGGVVLWDVVRRERLVDQPLAVAEGDVVSVAFSPDGKTLAAGYDGGVVLWDVARRERLVDQPLAVAEGGVESIAFSPDGKTLAAGCRRTVRTRGNLEVLGDGGVVLWDVARREWLVDPLLAVAEGGGLSVAFSPDGKILAAGGDCGVVLWDVVRRERLVDQPLAVVKGVVVSFGVALFDSPRSDRRAVLLGM